MKCGLCGSTTLDPLVQWVGSPATRVTTDVMPKSSPWKAVMVLTIGLVVLVEGIVFAFIPIHPILTVVGFFSMIFGGGLLLIVFGIFEGTPYKGRTGRVLNRTNQRLRRREQKNYSD